MNKFTQHGFTLIEVLISLILVSMGVVSSYSLYIGIARTLASTQQRNSELELLLSAGSYARSARLFPTDKTKQDPVKFSYQERNFILELQQCEPESMQVRAQLGTCKLSQVVDPDEDATGLFITYLIPYSPPEEPKNSPDKGAGKGV